MRLGPVRQRGPLASWPADSLTGAPSPQFAFQVRPAVPPGGPRDVLWGAAWGQDRASEPPFRAAALPGTHGHQPEGHRALTLPGRPSDRVRHHRLWDQVRTRDTAGAGCILGPAVGLSRSRGSTWQGGAQTAAPAGRPHLRHSLPSTSAPQPPWPSQTRGFPTQLCGWRCGANPAPECRQPRPAVLPGAGPGPGPVLHAAASRAR